jgi:hypothetical protein
VLVRGAQRWHRYPPNPARFAAVEPQQGVQTIEKRLLLLMKGRTSQTEDHCRIKCSKSRPVHAGNIDLRLSLPATLPSVVDSRIWLCLLIARHRLLAASPFCFFQAPALVLCPQIPFPVHSPWPLPLRICHRSNQLIASTDWSCTNLPIRNCILHREEDSSCNQGECADRRKTKHKLNTARKQDQIIFPPEATSNQIK